MWRAATSSSGCHAADFGVVDLLGLVLADGALEGLLEVLLPEQALPQVVHLLLELRRRAELVGLGGLGEQRVVDQVLGERPALDFGRQIAELAAELTLGKLHVGLGDRLAIDFRHNLVVRLLLGADRLDMERPGQEREGNNGDGREDAPVREHWMHDRSLMVRRAQNWDDRTRKALHVRAA